MANYFYIATRASGDKIPADTVTYDGVAGCFAQAIKILDGRAGSVYPWNIDSSGYGEVSIKAAAATLPVAAAAAQSYALKVDPGSYSFNDANDNATFVVKSADLSTGTTTVWTPTTGKKFVLCDLLLSCVAAGTFTVFDGTDSTTYRVFKGNLAANGGIAHAYRKPYISAAANNLLRVTVVTGSGYVVASGYEV